MVERMHIVKRSTRGVALFMLMLLANTSIAASLTATLDRTNVGYGRSVNLTVTASDVDGKLDFSPLQTDFEILNTSRSKSVQIVNGRMDSTLTWQISLMPLNPGKVTIPSFSLEGQSSRTIDLTVSENRQASGNHDPRDFVLELEVDIKRPFVQQQIILTARIIQARNILEGSLSDPQAEGIIFERLGGDKNYSVTKDDRQLLVIERRYVMFAQESGVLNIAPLKLVATVKKDPNSANGGFFSNTEKIHIRSNALTIDVQERAVGSSTGWWLPAQAVSLSADWDSDITTARVDEPITRNLMLSAKGVHSTQLPTITPPELSTAKIYPDQPKVSTQPLDDSILSYRTEKWAIIPRKTGILHLPEIRLSWYDTKKREFREEVIPAENINILPAEFAPQGEESIIKDLFKDSTLANSSLVENNGEPVRQNAIIDATTDNTPWKIIAIAAIVGWFATIFIIWIRIQHSNQTKKASASQLRTARVADLKRVDLACKRGDAGEINEALLAWSKDQWADGRARNLKDIGRVLQVEDGWLSTALGKIDAALYSSKSEQIPCDELSGELRKAVKRLGVELQKNKIVAESPLPQL